MSRTPIRTARWLAFWLAVALFFSVRAVQRSRGSFDDAEAWLDALGWYLPVFLLWAAAAAGAGVTTGWSISHQELRDDRAVFFLDWVPSRGTYTVQYLARCTLAGTATAPPAKVESMYDPENVALSASRTFTTN